jgi:lipopolysaccharide/colanic/teichoic acid biosynthesis glycosyltransferase
LTGALDRYLQDAALRTQHGAAGRARMLREFRQPPIWEAGVALYNSLLETRRPRLLSAAAKRCFDIIGSAVLLFLCAPLFALVALVIRLTMGSPVVFRQLRPGLLGRPFTLHKFRTMRLCRGAEDEMLPGADRITRLGRWLRDSSLDELPQLWDVLRGRMSLVGPRPLLLEYLPRYNKEQARRHLVKPGITGWAQVNGRNGITWEERFALDVWYVEHASLGLDLRVLLRTVSTVLTHDRVSPPDRVLMEQFNGS